MRVYANNYQGRQITGEEPQDRPVVLCFGVHRRKKIKSLIKNKEGIIQLNKSRFVIRRFYERLDYAE